MSADRVKWEHIHRVFEFVIEMFQKQPEDLKCIEEHFKEFSQKGHLNKLYYFSNFLNLVYCVAIKILNNSANKNG